MKKFFHSSSLLLTFLFTAFLVASCATQPEKPADEQNGAAAMDSEEVYYKVVLDEAVNGTVTVEPPIPADGLVKAGTQFTLTATPDEGYAVDSIYKMIWIIEAYNYGYFMESTESTWTLTVDPADGRFQTYGPSNIYKLGASFIKESELDGIEVTQNIEYARVGDKSLVYDVYAPEGAKDLPSVVIIHGGGWSANTEDIMRGMGREIAKTGKYVAFALDYRLLNDLDSSGNLVGNSLVDVIEDVFGAIAHIRKNAAEYGGDPGRLAVTGDSAGGHLAAVVANMPHMIGTGGFDGMNFEFWPTGVAESEVAAVRKGIMDSVKVAAPSYGVFTLAPAMAEEMPGLIPAEGNEAWFAQLSPMTHIPNASERRLPPQQCQIGSEDPIIPPAAVQGYVAALEQAGQAAEYIEVPGASHAYFDWKPDPMVQGVFNSTGKTYLKEMIRFFDSNI
ncbi:alpha/beta hydrolase fold domain-containing protein [Spirochaeta isovalerica]|uniref:Acetyl esterase/lipase n=1 Tax=Spirochaeta isovalerica TaxID=150 RepID=A0A841R9F8_9SPIO|nr:alpha/beta hydrolase fold domain-containing protein [Spirochaeta isovalerica]MBB6479847.1 acetyl esterase/lipase [Spirochaeta isovalerica]